MEGLEEVEEDTKREDGENMHNWCYCSRCKICNL